MGRFFIPWIFGALSAWLPTSPPFYTDYQHIIDYLLVCIFDILFSARYLFFGQTGNNMKSPSGFIWQLIHSMGSNEKLFFKRNFIPVKGKGEQLYLRLFNAIAAQKVYDEAILLEKFKPGLNKKNIAFQKNYLQKQICEALVQYEGIKEPEQDLYASIQLIRIYRKKGLYEEAFAIWKKAVIMARKREAFALLNLLKTEFEKMVIFSPPHADHDELLSIFKQNVITYAEYADMITLRDIYTETLLLKKKTHLGQDKEGLENIHKLLARVNSTDTHSQGQSFWFRHYYTMSKATLLYLLNDTGSSLSMLKELFTAWKKQEGFIRTHGEFYIELLYMINYAGILHGSYQYVTDAFNDPVNDLIKENAQRAYFEAIRYLALNKIYNKTARYEEVKKLLLLMKARYKTWEPSLNEDINSTLNFSLGVGSFVLDQFDDALFFTKRGISAFPEGTREEHISVGQLLLLLITYNINNSRLFDAQYRVTYQYFYKRKKKQVFESTLVQCLHRSFYMTDNKKKTEEFRKALAILETGDKNLVQQRAFAIFNFHGWLSSKVQRLSYRQYVEKKVKAGVDEPF